MISKKWKARFITHFVFELLYVGFCRYLFPVVGIFFVDKMKRQ